MLHERTLASDCCSLVALVLMYVGGPNYRWRALSEQVNASHGTDHLDHQRASAASSATLAESCHVDLSPELSISPTSFISYIAYPQYVLKRLRFRVLTLYSVSIDLMLWECQVSE